MIRQPPVIPPRPSLTSAPASAAGLAAEIAATPMYGATPAAEDMINKVNEIAQRNAATHTVSERRGRQS